MMIIPLASVGLTLLISFAVMYLIARYAMTVASFAPSIMVSVAIALSIDYSLFLLTRFREEKLRGLLDAEAKMRRFNTAQTRKNGAEVPTSPQPPPEPRISHISVAHDGRIDNTSPSAAAAVGLDDDVALNSRAVKRMLATAGHVVLISGTTLMLTFLG
jgi:uncharacterized membrane protein YdfJ with MMPL/SSD domain